MAIETLDDIYEEIMDGLGIYGAHDDRCEADCGYICRCCYSLMLAKRIRDAFYVDERLGTRK
jgi:hypothetical protein